MNTALGTAGQEHVLVVDDERPITDVLSQLIRKAGYRCSVANSAKEAFRILEQGPVDVLITDIVMPGMDGFELLKAVKQKYDCDTIVMTGFVDDYAFEQVIDRGATDFLSKGVSSREILVRLKRVLRERKLLFERDRALADLKETHQALSVSYLDTINRLALAAELKDEDTGDHIIRISRYSALLAQKTGLEPAEVQNILYSAPMHDVGKIGIPDNILLKAGSLSSEEFKVMKSHTRIGAKILGHSEAPVLKCARQIAAAHHEKWNGRGYPEGLAGESIPLPGRIVGIVDVFDALTSVRPYKNPYPFDVALNIIRKERGEHFDPVLVDVFLKHIDSILEIKQQVGGAQDVSLADFVWSERDKVHKTDQMILA